MKNKYKTAVFLGASLIVFCAGVGQILLSFAFNAPSRIIRGLGIVVEPARLGKHLVAYGLIPPVSEERIRWMAQFDLLDIGPETGADVVRIKALNPNVTVIAYGSIMSMSMVCDDWAEANAHEDWFLHDVNGNRIRAVGGGLAGWYGMNVGNSGWRKHFADHVKHVLETYPAIDGIFADNVWDFFRYDVWNVPKEQLPADIGPRFHNDMLGMVSFVKGTIGTKLLIVNTDSIIDDYADACDGKMQEGFVHATWQSTSFFWSKTSWETWVNQLSRLSKKGKYFLAYSGTKQDGTEANYHRVMLYCFTSYLLGYHGDETTFGWNSIYDSSKGYYTEFDDARQMGSPTNEHYSFGSVYARDFAEGKVLVNPTKLSYTLHLDSEYKTLDGEIVSDITLSANSGIVLLKP